MVSPLAEHSAVAPGAVLAGKYRLLSPLGEGAMGIVWRAEDLRLSGASVAIKVMHWREASNPEMRARFEAEAGTAAKLRGSPHIVQVLDVGVDEATNTPFIAMELLEGETLSERLLRQRVLAPLELGRVVDDVARGLTRAHDLGVVHRDLKPANIFLVRNHDAEVAKLLDFGIAKRLARSRHHAATATGALLGTPIYMSPEQIVSSRDVDFRADLWSLAVIAAECLTGKLPFESDNLPGLALAICQGRSTPPSRLGPVPWGFDLWFQRATQQQPDLRFGSAREMAEELRKLCASARRDVHGVEAAIEVAAERRTAPGLGAHRQLEATATPLPFTSPVVTSRQPSRRWASLARWGAAPVILSVAAGWFWLEWPAAPPAAAAGSAGPEEQRMPSGPAAPAGNLAAAVVDPSALRSERKAGADPVRTGPAQGEPVRSAAPEPPAARSAAPEPRAARSAAPKPPARSPRPAEQRPPARSKPPPAPARAATPAKEDSAPATARESRPPPGIEP